MKLWLNRSHFAKGGRHIGDSGYTITELLVVLGVTAALFSTILFAFSGRQQRVEFAQSVRDYESMLQTLVSDVSKGYYDSSNYSCRVESGLIVIEDDASSETGTNGDCVFLGKILEPSGSSSIIHTVVGSRMSGVDPRLNNLGFWHEVREVESDGRGVAIANPLRQNISNSYQLTVKKIVPVAMPSEEIGLVLFTNYSSSMRSVDAKRTTEVMLFKDSFIHDSTTSVDIDDVWGDAASNFFNEASGFYGSKGFVICLEGQNGQQAEIKVGTEDFSTNMITVIDTRSGEGGEDYCYGS